MRSINYSSKLMRNFLFSNNVKISFLRSNGSIRTNSPPVYFYTPRRFVINQDSWAADALESMGEKLAPGTMPMTLVTPETIEHPNDKVRELADQVLQLNMIECQHLVDVISKRLGYPRDVGMSGWAGGGGGGVEGGGQANSAAVPAAAVEPVKEKEIFDIKLTIVDAKAKIKIIKEVRAITGLGLKEAKELVEKAPVVIKTGVKKEELEALKKILLDAGAQIEII